MHNKTIIYQVRGTYGKHSDLSLLYGTNEICTLRMQSKYQILCHKAPPVG